MSESLVLLFRGLLPNKHVTIRQEGKPLALSDGIPGFGTDVSQ